MLQLKRLYARQALAILNLYRCMTENSGNMQNQDMVEQITIGGKSMESGKKYPPDAKVIITYHSAENKRIF